MLRVALLCDTGCLIEGESTMDMIKLNFKLGALEVEYEGPEGFAGVSLLPLMQGVTELDIPHIAVHAPANGSVGAQVSGESPSANGGSKLSTTDFAVRMGSKSGSDLALAAAAYLHLTMGMDEFRRHDILGAMKGAKQFYKASYGGNLTKSLDMLTKTGRLQNPGSDTYALPYYESENAKKYL